MFDMMSFLVGLFAGISLSFIGAMLIAVNLKKKQ